MFPVSFRMGGNEDGRGVGERLAVDPNDNRVLFFGSRHEGLWKSTDCAATWKKVETFPLKGLGNPQRGQPHAWWVELRRVRSEERRDDLRRIVRSGRHAPVSK